MRMRRIETPPFAPECHERPEVSFYNGVTLAEYQQVQPHRDKMLAAHHAAVEAYLAEMAHPDPDWFPSLAVLTGEYYLDWRERYGLAGVPQRASVSIMAHCLGVRPRSPGEPPTVGTYCGVDVVLLFHPAEVGFEVFYTGQSVE
jgi:hypothetical protein